MFRRNLIVFCAALYLIVYAAIAHAQLPQISSGLSYFTSSQNPDGTWGTGTAEVETTAATVSVLETLKLLNQTSGTSYVAGTSWLQNQSPLTVDYIADRIRILNLTDNSINSLLLLVDSIKGGCGGDAGYAVNILDTTSALQALKSANYDQSFIFSVIINLLANQNPDGGWGFTQNDDSNIYLTAIVSATLAQFKTVYIMDQQIANAVAYLLTKQNLDGGFGTDGSTVYEATLAFIALAESGQAQGLPLQNALNYLTSTQSTNGSWNDDPYSTALALRAFSYVKPDLVISAPNIAVSPTAPAVGGTISITATVSNTGLETATNVNVRLLNNGAMVGEQTISAIAPGGNGQAVFAISPLTPVGEHILTIAVDPGNTIDETSKANNTATTRIWARAPADLVVQPEYLTITPAYPKPGESVTLAATIANMGESDAGAFTADLYDGDPNNGGTKLGSFSNPGIVAGQLGNGSISFSLTAAGNHTLTLVVDPQHAVPELSTANNTAQKAVTVNATGGTGFIDLTIPMNGLQVTPQRPHAGDNVTVTLLAENLGTEVASAEVELFDGNPVAGGALLYKSSVTLNAGESRTLTVPWQIPSGVRTLYAYIDRANIVAERDESNNSQTLSIMADMVDIEVSAADISITPEHPMDGDPATVKVVIQNRGIAATGAFNVKLYNGDPNNDGTLLQTFAISNLAGDATQELSYPFTAARGTYRFYAICDPENQVTELHEDNNLAIRSLLVKTSAEAKGPDLVPLEFDLSGVTTDPQSLRISGTATVKFQNKGDDKVATPFRITVFEDKDGDGLYTEGTDLALGYWDYATAMNPNMVGIVTINLAGTVTFRDAPIYAMLDSGQVVFEQNKTNNTVRKGSVCENRPANPIEPVLKWKFSDPTFGRISTSPVVISLTDTNGDGRIDDKDAPAILINSLYSTYLEGKLWAFDGKTGTPAMTRYVAGQAPYEGGYPIVGDIDVDGKPEIIVGTKRYGEGILAFANDGSLKWDNSAQVTAYRLATPFHHPGISEYSLPALADLDGDGHTEIIFGRTIINFDGSVRCAPDSRLGGGLGWTNGFGYSNSVADLYMDGNQKIIAGNTAYNNDCTIKWHNTSLPDGLTVVGNLDDDPYPEIVMMSSATTGQALSGSRLYLLGHDGTVNWGPVYLSQLEGVPNNGFSSHPIIADFDGDGKPEIGVRGTNKFLILDSDGQVKMAVPLQPSNGSETAVAPAVFDLDGDGRPEILFSNNGYLRIFDGKDGKLRYEEAMGLYAFYSSQSIVIADVDGDEHAEAVVVGNSNSYGMPGNIRVYGAKNNDWVNTRRIWNQPSYHVTNINDDGSIPKNEAPSWLLNNNYRSNVPTSQNANPYLAADISASFVRVDMVNYPASVTITARIGNGGAKQAATGIRTAFYDGNPAAGGVLIGSALTTKALNPGDYEDVTLVWNNPAEGNHTIGVSTDADNTQSECDKGNNSITLPVYMASGKPDLCIVADDIVAAATIPEGNQANILVTIRNSGTLQADNVLVRLYAGNPALGGKQIGSDRIVPALSAGGSITLTTSWNTLGASGVSYLYALVDPVATTADANRGNNTANRQIIVTPAVKPDLQIGSGDITITPASPQEGDTLTVIATIHNRGSQTGNIKVALYDGIPTAGGLKRGETIIPQIIAQGTSAQASFTLDTIGLGGSHALYVRIDPDNAIDESDKTNNQASRNVTIAATGLTAAIATDKSAYSANENVQATVSLAEQNGRAHPLVYDLQVLDSKGVPTSSTPETTLNLGANDSLNVTIAWNTGSTYAGSYTVIARIKENNRIIAKAATTIIITPVKTADARIVVDKTAYRANEQVAINATITGTSSNYLFTDLNAKTSILNGSGEILYTATRTIPSLANGQRVELKNYWNTGTHVPGTYPAVIEVTDATGTVITTRTQNIVISSVVAPSALLKGAVAVDKQRLLAGETVNVSFDLTNRGNMDVSDVALSVLTVHVVNQTIYNTLSYQSALPMGATFTANGQIDTTNFTAKDYLVILRANIGGMEETLASSYFQVEGAPSAPALAGPLNGSDVVTFTPLFSVNNASDPNDDKLTYEFELYTDSGLTNLAASVGAIPADPAGITGWTVSAPLSENQVYYWRARAFDGRLYGPWMTPATLRVNTVNDPPTPPTISTPANDTAIAVLSPVLTVNNASDPDSAELTYNFEIALDPDFTQIEASLKGVVGGQGTTSWTAPASLQDNRLYYWRAQADDWLMEGPWSAVSRFFVSTANDPPTTPVITAPANGTTINRLVTDVVVSNSTDPDSSPLLYYFEADTVQTFDSPGIIRSGNIAEGSGSTLWHLNGLLDNTLYYLRAKAGDGSADSPWSEVAGFFANTANDSPTTPVLANPSNGAGVSLFTPTLSVHNATDLDKDVLTYEFEVYSDVSLTNLVAQTVSIAESAPLTAWTVPVVLTENQTYYWRARAFDGSLRSAWMPTGSFMVNTANDAPGAPQLSTPTDGKSLATLTPTLTVVNAVDPDNTKLTYDFEVYNNGILVDSSSGAPEGAAGLTSVTLTKALSDNAIYSWRARAYDGDRYGPWMNMATFTTHIAQATITPQIEFDPRTLNKNSNGNWVNVKIGLPRGYKAADIDIASLRLNGTVPAELRPTSIQSKSDGDTLMIKFPRNGVIAVLTTGEQVAVHVSGKVGATAFEGVCIIRVID